MKGVFFPVKAIFRFIGIIFTYFGESVNLQIIKNLANSYQKILYLLNFFISAANKVEDKDVIRVKEIINAIERSGESG